MWKACGRVLVRVAALLVGAWVAYLVDANVALGSGAVKLLVDHIRPERFFMDYSSAWSPWPGRFHLHGLVVRGNDRAVEWRITTERARLALDVPQLARKHIHISQARAWGATVRVRRKLEPSEATPGYVAKLPPIAGLPSPPLRSGPPPKKISDARYDLVVVDLDDVVVDDVREVWIDALRFTERGGSAEGGFHLKPQRWLRVDAQVRMQRMALDVGDDPVIVRSHGAVLFHIPWLDLHAPTRESTVHAIDAEVLVRGETGDLRFLDPLLARYHLSVAGGRATALVRAEITRGLVQPKTHVVVHPKPWTLAVRDQEVSFGASPVVARVEARPTPSFVTWVDASDVRLEHRGVEVARSASALFMLSLRDRDLGQTPLRDWSASANVPDVTAPDLRRLSTYASRPLFEGGSARGSIHADVSRFEMQGAAVVLLSRAATRVGKVDVTGNGSLHAKVRARFDTGDVSITDARAEIHGATVGKEHGYWASATAAPFFIDAKDGVATTFVTCRTKNPRGVLALIGMPGILRWMSGDDPVVGSASVQTTGKRVDVEDVRVEGSHFEVRGTYEGRPGLEDGHFLLRLPVAKLGIVVTNRGASLRPL